MVSIRTVLPFAFSLLGLAACQSEVGTAGESVDAVVIVDEMGVIAWANAYVDIPLGTEVTTKADLAFNANDLSASSETGCTFARSMGPDAIAKGTKLVVAGQVSGLPVGGARSKAKLSGNWLMLRSATDARVWVGLGCTGASEKRIASSYVERSQVDSVLEVSSMAPKSPCGSIATNSWVPAYKVMLGMTAETRVEATDISTEEFEGASLVADGVSCVLQRTPFTDAAAPVVVPKGTKFTFVGQLASSPLASVGTETARFACGTGLVLMDATNNFYNMRCGRKDSNEFPSPNLTRDDLDAIVSATNSVATPAP